ncbi:MULTISPECIES: nucleotide exchange factor GrpE [Corynebacterium]|uniref:Protein GrpE n=1 Tax=Corynebacterium haemomassiliense TaxID=2754726 RepID=A0A7W2EB94_9CORY|nr:MULTISPECIES: nucleotide exchange factor GrpE [Corynebacterium]MDL0402714.1 nucleotide exchange factor GrpE [Corynebacterium lehmanniae]MBA5244561.1 nucleotide exchange factor GrpE [Corynebacterium haemomassiliense]MCG7237082.1 nucleotide exchange factor GrpE [Corynebacterium sp. ACRQP]MCG7289385.1 nucleotide exchange factor GrpE [Corynebacterium sp. ACRPZ]MCG7293651.1 nucleotide exchange factor GrpE [Corynebacterium sp. ACRPY]
MTNPHNEQMPDNPGAPEATDPEYVSPDQAETLADEAAESEALATDEDPLLAADAELEDAAKIAENEIDPDVDGDGAVSDIELQLAERTESLQRVSAEYANYRRRTERERGELANTAKAKFATQLLPLLDDLDLAEQHGDLEQGPLKAFADKFRTIVAGQGIKEFGAEGDAFNPEIHEAVQDLSQGDTKAVGTVLRKGYMIGDRLVRNAMVIIADPADPAEPAGEPEADTTE